MKLIFALLSFLLSCGNHVRAELLIDDSKQYPPNFSGSKSLQFGLITVISVSILFLSLFIYTFIIKPYLLVRYYRKQGIPMHYAPFFINSSREWQNTLEKGDHYYDWIQIGKQEPRPKALGKNFGQSAQILLIDPEAIKQFFINHESYIKDPFIGGLTKTLNPHGLVMVEGKLWRKHRKLLSNGFEFEQLRDVVPDVLKYSIELVESYKGKDMNNFIVFDEFRDMAGEIIGRIFFDESIGKQIMQGKRMTIFLADLIAKVNTEPGTPLYLLFGLKLVKTEIVPRHRQLMHDIREFRKSCRDTVMKNMEKRREDYKNRLYPYQRRKNIFDIFFDFEINNPADSLSEDEIIDEYTNFFTDGVYTTGHFISMCSYYLEKNPIWRQKVIEEMNTLFPSISDITYENINKMDILSACMKETQRLAPPVATAIERIALSDHELAGIKIKKGTIMMACHPANLLDERFFEDPHTYNPERWLKPSKSQESVKKYPSLFIPFSMGARRCLGQNFAVNEAKVLLTVFMRTFRYELRDKDYQLRFTQRFLREPLEPIVYKLNLEQNIAGS